MADNTVIDDAITYPILTEEVDYPVSAPDSSGVGAASISRQAESAIREVLGWRPKSNDPKGFVAALTQAFEIKDVEGHVEWKWTPRTYAIRADLGAITGAQASIYQRAKAALDQSLPLLDGLYPLDPAFDPQLTDAIRLIVRNSLVGLVTELGMEGGPRLAVADDAFEVLLGTGRLDLDDPEQVKGGLDTLRNRFGLYRARVNTIEEEQNFTNFLILVDYVNSLKRSWDFEKIYFDRRNTGVDKFLGTQSVLLARDLAVIAESVQEVTFAMNSVFLGPAERQTYELDCDPKMTIAELLDWAQRFTSDEGPRLIQDAGKDGVQAVAATLEKIRQLVRNCLLT
jgi:hypothetical protein